MMNQLFHHMRDTHGLTLTLLEEQEIVRIVNQELGDKVRQLEDDLATERERWVTAATKYCRVEQSDAAPAVAAPEDKALASSGGSALDDVTKKPRLFYYEESRLDWLPLPEKTSDLLDCSHMDDGYEEIVEIELQCREMTDLAFSRAVGVAANEKPSLWRR